MKPTITLSKWNKHLDQENPRKFYINPVFIIAIEELSPSSKNNLGPRTRIDYGLPGFGAHSVLVQENNEQIESLISAYEEKIQSKASDVEVKNF